MPDTVYVCPLLRIGVVCSNPVLMRNGISCRGSFHFHFHSTCPTPQNHCHPPPVYLSEKENPGGIFMHRMWRKMTGKFRKVASHHAPEPAFGLFLNLPEGLCLRSASVGSELTSTGRHEPPWNPRYVNLMKFCFEMSTGNFRNRFMD